MFFHGGELSFAQASAGPVGVRAGRDGGIGKNFPFPDPEARARPQIFLDIGVSSPKDKERTKPAGETSRKFSLFYQLTSKNSWGKIIILLE